MYGTLKLNEDITVPRSKLPTLLEGIDEISKNMVLKFLALDIQGMEMCILMLWFLIKMIKSR